MPLPPPELWKRLSPLLDELLDLPAEDRAARLLLIQQQDASLAAELRRLIDLDAAARASQFLVGRAGTPPTGETPPRNEGPDGWHE